jgi:NAD(P)-dependent dehydrogenase (short-subunit alcohol dehydrogenase family)
MTAPQKAKFGAHSVGGSLADVAMAVLVGGCLAFGVVTLHDTVSPPLFLTPVAMGGKTVLITGASSGTGMESTRILAGWNADVVMACRNLTKCEAVRASIIADHAAAGVTVSSKLTCEQLDLCDFSSVRSFAAQYLESGRSIDVLMNNAGVHVHDLVQTADGIEEMYQANHLGHFLLTNLLLDRIVQSAPARILHVSSGIHFVGGIDRAKYGASEALTATQNAKDNFNGWATYADSKLMNIIFSNELQRKLTARGAPANVVSNSLHPGFVVSAFGSGSGAPAWMGMLMEGARVAFARNTSQGAYTQVHVATAPGLAEVGGAYFDHAAEKKAETALAFDEETAKWLWDTSATLVKL